MNTNEETKEKETLLTPQQELFCRYFTQNDVLMGNATHAYAEAFGFNIDEERRDDELFLFKDGTEHYFYEIRNNPIEDQYHPSKGNVIQQSSYDKVLNNVKTYASKLRKKEAIQKRCRELLNEMMTDEVIDSRLVEIIRTGKDVDSISAIKEYNKLKQRIVDKKDITSGGKPITVIFDPAFNKNGITHETETDSSKPQTL